MSETIASHYLYNFDPAGVPPHKYHLEIGAPVMVIRSTLHLILVNGKLFVLVPVDRYTMHVVRFDEQFHVVETDVLHCMSFASLLPDIPMTWN